MIGNFKPSARSGFTLIEALIAAAISSVLVVSIVSIFVLFQKLQNNSYEDLQLQTAARRLINLVTEQLRTGYVDYAFYAAAPSAETRYLATRTPDGEQTVMQFFDTGLGMNVYICKKPFDEICPKGGDPTIDTAWSQINTNDVQFILGRFDIQPDSPQFYSSTLSDDPQLVTMRIQLSTTTDETHQRSGVIQITLTPRIYAR